MSEKNLMQEFSEVGFVELEEELMIFGFGDTTESIKSLLIDIAQFAGKKSPFRHADAECS